MSKVIGDTFGDELQAAGVADGVAWRDGDLIFADSVTETQRAAVMAVYNAHDATKPAPSPVPQTVTRYQAEVHMRRVGLWESADALFAALPDSDERKIAWLRAPTFNRDSPALVYAAQQMGIDAAALDTLFVEASKII